MAYFNRGLLKFNISSKSHHHLFFSKTRPLIRDSVANKFHTVKKKIERILFTLKINQKIVKV